MHLYAAGRWPEADIKYKKRLYSYADGKAGQGVWAAIEELLTVIDRPRVLVDSGAFTVWNSGGVIHLEDYIEFITETKRRFINRLEALHFISLDVIGDPEKTRENHKKILKHHPDVLPVVTRGASKRDINWALDVGQYIAIGGLVWSGGAKHQDAVFAEIVRRWKRGKLFTKVHLLGVTNLTRLLKYPAYSSDSTSWVSPGRYGNGVRVKNIPKIKEFGDIARQIRDAELRAMLKQYKNVERKHAEIWASRGLKWDE